MEKKPMVTPTRYRWDDEISIVLAGAAGQGIQTVEEGVSRLAKQAGYHVFASKEYMSRIRGGSNSTQIRVASHPVAAPLDRIDLFIPLDEAALTRCTSRLGSATLVLAEKALLPDRPGLIDLPLTDIAEQAGDRRYASSVAIGAVLGLLDISLPLYDDFLRQRFADEPEEVISGNREAAAAGHRQGRELIEQGTVHTSLRAVPPVAGDLLLNGSETVGLGALAGGCNFISSYPMSPATGVLIFLAGQANEMGLVVDQAEDEIAAVNMALGAWFAGARAMVSTSGGGFDLMTEGLSLAGMIESPLVVHLAQRSGPATGLPTRTEQGDLLMAAFSGHGEFPRLILAPGSLPEAFNLARRAFDLADRYQIPVILLTDQFLLDSFRNIPALDLHDLEVCHQFVKSGADYARYRLTASGISPRALPGHGDGLVCLDSDEHDEAGHITEDFALRRAMTDKRLRKGQELLKEAIAPQLLGRADYHTLVVSWGSTFHVLEEGLDAMKDRPVSGLHFSQLYPLPPEAVSWLRKARRLVVVENNASGQFAVLLEQAAGCRIDHRILKYDGLPFTVEGLRERLAAILDKPDGNGQGVVA
jgi:2-oxoglutarate ferredoxin oxidoreductase subunit alpha